MNLTRMMDCLDADLCDQIIKFPGEYRRSSTILSDETDITNIRTNYGCNLVGPLERAVHERLNAALLAWSKQIESEYPEIAHCLYLPGVRHNLETYREPLGLLRYTEGQEYEWHVDAPAEQDQTGGCSAPTRLVSSVIYLNDDFQGGETEMLGRKFKPKKGKVLIFPSNWNYPHRACPVPKGTKYALVTWFHPDLRAP